MKNDTIIKIENLSKQYRLGVVGTGTVSDDLKRWWTTGIRRREDPFLKIGEKNIRSIKGESKYIWALRNINLEFERGDVVGIIGKNGAGKSTLLKILSRVTRPTTGSVKYNGRIASLLEVGTGFHPELTGKENIYMNGAIMGLSRSETTKKLDEIISFAGVERYINTPVKRYSSGMTVRLGFSIAAHLEPDILVVDEVLAVGDIEFQQKAIGKIQNVSQSANRTVLFVSHNMGAVKKLCKKGIVIKDGQIDYRGSAEEAINVYSQTHRERTNLPLFQRIDRQGEGKFKFTDIIIYNKKNVEVNEIISGELTKIHIYYENSILNFNTNNLVFAFIITDLNGHIITRFSTLDTGHKIEIKNKSGVIIIEIPKTPLRGGNYLLSIAAYYGGTRTGNAQDIIENAMELIVHPGDFWSTGKYNRTGTEVIFDFNILAQ